MNDELGYPIMWSKPNLDGTKPAWDGPAPDAVQSREEAELAEASASNQHSAKSLGGMASAWNESAWTAEAPSEGSPAAGLPHGSLTHQDAAALGWAGDSAGPTASDLSANEPRSRGFGWDMAPEGPQFHAPDAPDHLPNDAASTRQQSAGHAAPAPDPDAAFKPAPASGGSHAVDPHAVQLNAEPAPSAHGARPAPASYSDAPVSELHAPSFGAPSASVPAAPSTGEAPAIAPVQDFEPPEVIANNDDLSDDSLTIGRSRDNSIVLDDMLVSRRHVVITADDEGLLLRDVGSRNGTFVNGRRVEQIHLHEGDRIGIGASTFEVRDGWLVAI